MKIINHRHHVEMERHTALFNIKDGCGYEFDCDARGVVLDIEYPEARANYAMCLALVADGAIPSPHIECYRHSYIEPAIGRCDCGGLVTLSDPLDNDCGCGRCYNMSGQEVQANYGRAECIADGCAWDESDY